MDSSSALDWIDIALTALTLFATLAVAYFVGRPSRLLYSVSTWDEVPVDRPPGQRRRHVRVVVHNLSGRVLLWTGGRNFDARDFDGPLLIPLRPGWILAKDASCRPYPDGGSRAMPGAWRETAVEVAMPNLPKGRSFYVDFVLEEVPNAPGGQRLRRWLRIVAGLDPVGTPHADSSALTGFRRRFRPAVLYLLSMASLSAASMLLELAALAGPTAWAIPMTGAAVFMLAAVGLFGGALAAAGPGLRHQISFVRRRGASVLWPGLVGTGPGPDFVPPIMLGLAAFYRWLDGLFGAPQLTAGSWALLALALAWLAARSVVVWRPERARGAAHHPR